MEKKFSYQTFISMSDTDMTGVIYFTNQFRLGLQAFEALLQSESCPLSLLLEGETLFPIVHVNGDFFSPLKVGDQVEIFLSVSKIGSSSFHLKTELFHSQSRVKSGENTIVHVSVDRVTGKSTAIPSALEKILRKFL